MEIIGKVKLIRDEQSFASGFTKREFVITTEEQYPQDIQFELEEIGKKQARLAEVHWQPNPGDEIQCTNCDNVEQAIRMFKRPRGSFYYCRSCAPMIGILPDEPDFDSD